MARFDARSHCLGASNRQVRFAETIVREVERDRSFKICQFFAECVREARQPAAVHPQRMVLLFNLRRANAGNVRHSRNDRLFRADNLCRAVSAGGILIEINNGVCF